MTLRCGNRPKCWKTIEKRVLRNSRSLLSSTFRISSSSKRNSPCVGSINRVMQRTSVDLPEPESPITTKTSPGATSKETSRTAIVLPVFARNSCLDSKASGVPIIASGFDPKTFHRFRTEIIGAWLSNFAPFNYHQQTILIYLVNCWSKCVLFQGIPAAHVRLIRDHCLKL